MKVYRYLGARELEEILAGNTDTIGKTFSKKAFRLSNSHRYKEGVRYLHFFQNIKDIEKIKFEHQNARGKFYVCTFDIPKKLMKKGVGRYTNQRGYDFFVEKAKEYILPANDLDCKFLCSYQEIEK